MQQRKCKNCGASIEHLYNHKCPYCRSFIDFNIEQTEEINPRYMYDVEVRNIDYDFVTNRMVIYFKGKYLKASETLEYTNNNTLMRIDYQSMIPRDVFYAVSFSKEEFYDIMYKNDIHKFIQRFPFELDIHNFIKSLIDFKERGAF